MIFWPVRNDVNFKPQQILYQKRTYLGVKKKESGNQRESTFTNIASIFEGYLSTWSKEQ